MHHHTAKTKGIEFNLEALRGACAFFVVIFHVVLYQKYIDPHYFPRWMNAFNIPGHFCVLIFFVLSGYVIGISNSGRLSADKIIPYLKKRFIRIYPVYFVCLTAALLIAVPYTIKTIVANYTMMQGLLGAVVWENNPLWSLNYEIIYYLLFIPLSFFEIKPWVALVGAIAIGLINFLLFPTISLPIISAYSYGFAFWATGWCLAVYFKNKEVAVSPQKLLSGIFLLASAPVNIVLAYPYRLVTQVFDNELLYPNTVYWAKNMVKFDDFTLMPYCFLLVVLFSGTRFRFKKQLFSFLFILPAISIALLIKGSSSIASLNDQRIPMLCYLISLVLYFIPNTLFNNLSRKIINLCFWLGSVSYGLYVIHFPVMIVFGKVTAFSGSTVTFITRFLLLFLPACLAAAYVLEKKMQPLVGRKLRNVLLPSVAKR
ncbi:acyltransferase [Mucilaginibacter sp. CSA2-8R]|uniref:acyltransferase family protein n=1 Tax=Mucilaginibacter sp. CSA2-8R TaxID=3141542 RepID=UPI00315C5BE1